MVVPPPDMVHNKCQVRAAIRVELSAMANGTNGTGLRVAIVAPDGLVRDGVLHLLSRHRFEIVAEGTASVAREGTPSLSPEILVVAMTPLSEAVEIVKISRTACPGTKVIVISDQTDLERVAEYIDAGASAFVPSSIASSELVKIIALAALDMTIVPSGTLGRGVRDKQPRPSMESNQCETRIRGLSPREASVLTLVKRGESNKQIARHLEIAEATVKVHVKSILRKLAARNRTEAATSPGSWPEERERSASQGRPAATAGIASQVGSSSLSRIGTSAPADRHGWRMQKE
jgi:two-component system nitrate/nitrite response regulator NarL